MDPVVARLNQLREERVAREKARIEKLRELNLKKYNRGDENTRSTSNLSINKSVRSEINVKSSRPTLVKNNFHVNSSFKRPISAVTTKPTTAKDVKTKEPNSAKGPNKQATNIPKPYQQKPITKKDVQKSSIPTLNNKYQRQNNNNDKQNNNNDKQNTKIYTVASTSKHDINDDVQNNEKKEPNVTHDKKEPIRVTLNKSANLRKSLALPGKVTSSNPAHKSMFVKPTTSQKDGNHESVFERLYKPKPVHKTQVTDIEKLRTDPNYFKKLINSTNLILNKRHTVFDTKPKVIVPVRKSYSAIHFKRISKNEMKSNIQKWSSIGDNINNVHLKHINEDENVKEDKVVSAVKSEAKKVKFQTPMSNFNTPRPEELQSRLQAWLEKRGKGLDSYHHLQCFGINHLPHRLNFEKLYNDENKENIAVDSDSDDGSYTENMNEEESVGTDKWRTASSVSDTDEINTTLDTTLTGSDVMNVNEILLGALNDLTELLREGFDWEQSARWLRAIRERFPSAPHSAVYWECRAALEERRGDLPASVQCWEEAIAKGTEHSVVEANLDQLLDKFMQLKISPNSGKRQTDPKLVDVKNVFKSTIIRFAVQQAKLRQSTQAGTPKFTVTPVRRSGRLSTKRTPLQAFTTMRQADRLMTGQDMVFVPNKNLYETP